MRNWHIQRLPWCPVNLSKKQEWKHEEARTAVQELRSSEDLLHPQTGEACRKSCKAQDELLSEKTGAREMGLIPLYGLNSTPRHWRYLLEAT